MQQEVDPFDEFPKARKRVPKFDTPLRYSVDVVAVRCPDAEARRGAARAILARLLARSAMEGRDGEIRRKAA